MRAVPRLACTKENIHPNKPTMMQTLSEFFVHANDQNRKKTARDGKKEKSKRKRGKERKNQSNVLEPEEPRKQNKGTLPVILQPNMQRKKAGKINEEKNDPIRQAILFHSPTENEKEKKGGNTLRRDKPKQDYQNSHVLVSLHRKGERSHRLCRDFSIIVIHINLTPNTG